MKTILIGVTAFLISVTGSSVNAQSSTGAKFGGRVGLNIANITKTGDADFSSGSKAGINAAVFLELPFSKAIAFQPELQFSQKGYKASGTFLASPYEYKQTTNFIEVPLLLKLKPSNNFGIVVGPQFSFLTSTSTKFTVNNSSYESQVKSDNDNLRKNILGGVLGIEAALSHAVVGVRYNLDFQTNNGDGTSSTPKYKNQVIAFSVGFKL